MAMLDLFDLKHLASVKSPLANCLDEIKIG